MGLQIASLVTVFIQMYLLSFSATPWTQPPPLICDCLTYLKAGVWLEHVPVVSAGVVAILLLVRDKGVWPAFDAGVF